MHFENLKDKCEYFRGLTDYKLTPNSYVIAMLDGRSFSKLIKNKYKKPFDNTFVRIMNEVAEYLVKNIQGAKFAYTQSDEISILITDFDTPETDAAFGYRICKLQSILAAMAASKFNQLALLYDIEPRLYDNCKEDCESTIYCSEDVIEELKNQKLAEFDCKVWSVPDYNTAFCHFLWRQNDCIRNSKQQTAQTYLSHKELMGKSADEQVDFLLSEKNIDWNSFDQSLKYGRLIYKERRLFKNYCIDNETAGLDGVSVTKMVEKEYIRNVWTAHPADLFGDENSVIKILIPQR